MVSRLLSMFSVQVYQDLFLRSIGTLIDPPDDPDRILSQKIHNRFERPNPKIVGSPEDLIGLLLQMLAFEPGMRPSAHELLSHPWFQLTAQEHDSS